MEGKSSRQGANRQTRCSTPEELTPRRSSHACALPRADRRTTFPFHPSSFLRPTLRLASGQRRSAAPWPAGMPKILLEEKRSRPERSHGLPAPGGSAIICRRRAGAGQERGRFRLQSVWHSDKGRKPTSPPLTCPTATIVATVCAQRLAVYREPDKVSQPVPKTETSFRQYPAGSHPPRLTSLFSLLYSHFSSGTRATRNPSSLDRTAG